MPRVPLALCLVPLAACARGPERWQALLDDLVASQGLPGGTLTVSTPHGAWSGASGVDGNGAAVTADARMPVGSLTKVFTATVVLQLQEEGAVDLDEPIDRWFPDLPRADAITVRHLLQHRSGLGDYLADADVASSWGEPWTPEALVEAALEVETVGDPGGDVVYSNTNYLLLGLVVEALDGRAWHESVRARILEPLALDATAFAGEAGALDGVAPGELAAFDGEGFVMHPSVTWAAGGLVSSGPDIDRFGRALYLDGELLSERSVTEMTDGAPYYAWPFHTATYGLGTIVVKTTLGRTAVGHQGGVPGFTSRLVIDREAGLSATVLVNKDGVTSWPICENALDGVPSPD